MYIKQNKISKMCEILAYLKLKIDYYEMKSTMQMYNMRPLNLKITMKYVSIIDRFQISLNISFQFNIVK